MTPGTVTMATKSHFMYMQATRWKPLNSNYLAILVLMFAMWCFAYKMNYAAVCRVVVMNMSSTQYFSLQ